MRFGRPHSLMLPPFHLQQKHHQHDYALRDCVYTAMRRGHSVGESIEKIKPSHRFHQRRRDSRPDRHNGPRAAVLQFEKNALVLTHLHIAQISK